MVRYLTVVRATCEALVRSPDDPRARQRLEQACQILNVLICDAKSSARHEETALGQYRRLLEPLRPPQQDAGDFSKIKASICGVIRSPHSLPAARAADFCRQAVEIERKFYLDAERALREESMPREASGNAQGGAIPSAAAVSTYLSGIFGRPAEVLEINTVSLGYSKATYLLTMRPSADVPAALVIRMDRPFNYLGTTVVDEYPILTVLHENGIAVPRPYALEPTGEVLGQPFLVVSRVYGKNVGSHFSFPPPNPDLCAQMGATLAQIHSLPVEQFGARLRGVGQSGEAQIAAEIARYHADWTALDALCPTVDAAFRWIQAHASDAVGVRTLVHGDFSLSNVLVSEDNRVTALLDWEFSQLGTPAADIGWFFTAAERLASWENFLAAYGAAGGTVPAKKSLDFYRLWGLLRLTVMTFQVESAFEAGRMDDIKQAYAGLFFPRECVKRLGAFLSGLPAGS